MRNITCILLLLMAIGCAEKDSRKRPGANEQEASIIGNWLIYQIGLKEDYEDQNLLKDTLSAIKTSNELGTMTIGADYSFLTEDTLGKQLKKHWQLLPPDMIGFKEDDDLFEIVKTTDSTLTLSRRIDTKNGATDVLFACKRIDPEKYNGKDLSTADLNSWRNKPIAAESNEQLAKRITSLLNYNHIYILSISNSPSDYFNTKRFHLPFRYYNGGMGLKDFDSTTSFSQLFFNGADAKKGYDILKESFNVRDYPKEKDYMLAYAAFMKGMAEVIEMNK